MAQPTPYTRVTDFSTDESGLVAGRSTVRTARVDAELDALGLTANETRVNLGIIQRDDTKLRDGAVELHTLAADVRALLSTNAATPRGAWLTATTYAVSDLVIQNTNTYICAVAHTSGTFATDLAAVRWLLVALGSAVAASAVSFAPTATLAATSVQAAIEEADTEGRALSAAASAAVVTALADLASTASGKGPGLVGFSYASNYAVSTLGGVAKTLGIDVTQAPYLADKTGATSASAAISAAAAANPGIPLRCPAGTYRLDTEVAYVTTSSSVFTPGFQLSGDGPGLTIFDNRVASGFAFRCATNTTGKFQHTVKFRDFKIITTTSPASSGGISLRSCYNTEIENVWINGMTGDGIKVIVSDGDLDASNMMLLRMVRLENCLGWGFNADVTGAFNEFSFLRLEQVFIQACGTASATMPPPSGGMRWKGQILSIDSSAWTINENVGLYIQGGAGLSNTVTIQGSAWENNKKRGIYVSGIDLFRMRVCQIYNNDSYVATSGVEFDGASSAIKHVYIDETLVRVTSGNNAFTAFKISGANADLNTARVWRTSWKDFDYAGQTRFSGFQFDTIQQDLDLVALSTTSTVLRPSTRLGRGNKSPMRLRGPVGAGGVASTSGEWVAKEFLAPGISISNSGLAANTRYYCYLFDNNGSDTLELSTTIFATDASSGYSVKTGDATKLYVGSVETDAGSLFLLTAGGWLNPLIVPGSQVGVPTYMWCDSTGRLRVRYSVLPTSDTDGTVVGTQT